MATRVSDTKVTGEGDGWLSSRGAPARPMDTTTLVIAWSLASPGRVGEIAQLAEGGPRHVLGRGPTSADDPEPRVRFHRSRPGSMVPGEALEGDRISRRQLLIRSVGGRLELERIGRCPLWVNGLEVDEADVLPGDTVVLERQVVFLCVRRPLRLPELRHATVGRDHAFGGPDAYGIVGESPAVWALRDQLAFAAQQSAHVLLLGPSGSGKELAARAIHGMSSRSSQPLMSRNAATFPAGILDAELFGNVKGYPNPGMAARPGVIGQAHGSTLFLDEIGEMSTELQSHLLRVLDAGGEYHRLGDSQPRSADLRLVAATNRPRQALKHDLAARLTMEIEIPPLDARREDIPLLVRHQLRAAAAENADLGRRFFDGWDGRSGEPRVHPNLLEALLCQDLRDNVRAIDRALWRALSTSASRFVEMNWDLEPEPGLNRTPDPPDGEPVFADPRDLDSATIQECLDRLGGNQSRAYKELGLKNRDVLYRLIKKYGIVVRREAGNE